MMGYDGGPLKYSSSPSLAPSLNWMMWDDSGIGTIGYDEVMIVG